MTLFSVFVSLVKVEKSLLIWIKEFNVSRVVLWVIIKLLISKIVINVLAAVRTAQETL